MFDLSESELDRLRSIFFAEDREVAGFVPVWELHKVFAEVGKEPGMEILTKIINQISDDDSGTVGFDELKSIIINQLWKDEEDVLKSGNDFYTEAEVLEAFISLSGGFDMTGEISIPDLVAVCKKYDLTVDTMTWINEVDTDGTGEIDFLEFGRMMQPEKRIFQVPFPEVSMEPVHPMCRPRLAVGHCGGASDSELDRSEATAADVGTASSPRYSSAGHSSTVSVSPGGSAMHGHADDAALDLIGSPMV